MHLQTKKKEKGMSEESLLCSNTLIRRSPVDVEYKRALGDEVRLGSFFASVPLNRNMFLFWSHPGLRQGKEGF